MPGPELELIDAAGTLVWRVGRVPDPWAWIDRQYAGKARWDDPDVNFRTTYAADTLYACFVEALAYARPDVNEDGSGLLDGIDEDPDDARSFPTPPAGSIERSWIESRMIGTAHLDGRFVNVRAASTVASLRPSYVREAVALGFDDFDAAALKIAFPRELTQNIAVDLYKMTYSDGTFVTDGVHFGSRHGDDLALWAIFERSGDDPSSGRLECLTSALVASDDADLLKAMSLHGLTFRD